MMLLAGTVAAISGKVSERRLKIKGIGAEASVYFAAILTGAFVAFFIVMNAFGIISTPNPFPA